jgi:hypothetical protein
VDGRSDTSVYEWTDENRGDRVHSPRPSSSRPRLPAGSFAVDAGLDPGIRHLDDRATRRGRIERPRTASIMTLRGAAGAHGPPSSRAASCRPVRNGVRDAAAHPRRHPRSLPSRRVVELRPAGEASQFRRIWEAEVEAFAGHWGAAGGRLGQRPAGRTSPSRPTPGPLLSGRSPGTATRSPGWFDPFINAPTRTPASACQAGLVREHLDAHPVAGTRASPPRSSSRALRELRDARHDRGRARGRRAERDRRTPASTGGWASVEVSSRDGLAAPARSSSAVASGGAVDGAEA